MNLHQGIKFPDTAPDNSLFDFGDIHGLLQQNVQIRGQECDFPDQKFANSLYFSLLAGNSRGEGLARDCALRQTV